MQHGAESKNYKLTMEVSLYLSHELTEHLKSKGMVRNITIHDTPEENSVSEHLNRTLLEHAWEIHLTIELPKFLWTESVQHAVCLKNCTSMHVLDGKTLYEMVHGTKPDLTDLPEWGTRVFILKED